VIHPGAVPALARFPRFHYTESFMQENGIVSASLREEERQFETALRPLRLADFAGQTKLKEQLAIAIEAARKRGEAMDHVLLYGPPGLGKTTLAGIIAAELGVGLQQTSGPVLQKKLDLVGILSNVAEREVFFIDEIHRLQPDVEEMIYSALEDFRMDILIGTGPGARTVAMDIKPFTAIGATTRQGIISAPLRGRFGLVLRLNPYEVEELARIVRRSAKLLDVEIDDAGAEEIARRSRGTPRIANRLLRRVRDFAQIKADGLITRAVAIAAMQMLKVDAEGFDALDRRLLTIIIDHFDGGPVGVESLAAALSEERGTIEDVLEPFLIQQGFLMRTARGRMVTNKAYRHLGLKPPKPVAAIGSLFDEPDKTGSE
jgi:Holliday junction DNA helicase RuvB